MKRIPEMGGLYTSRKFLLTLLGLILMVCIAIAGMFSPAIPAVMPTFTGGVLGVLSLYFAGNVTNKYVVGKTLLQPDEEDDTAGDAK